MAGYLGGLPLFGGPLTLYLALDHGAAFAAQSATLTLAAILGQGAHLLAFAHAGRRARWPIALAAGWSAFAVVSLAIAPWQVTPIAAAALAAAGLTAAGIALPRTREALSPPLIPPAELRLRVAAAFALAVLIVWSADRFGPVVSGVLLSVPVTGSIMPPFTLALYGPAALARLMRGFVIGLTGFAAFFLTLALTIEAWGIPSAFALAILDALAAVFVARRLASLSR
jgi:hypothetical protein